MSEILSQEEINALLSSFAKREEERATRGPETRRARPYDFRRPDKLSKDQLRAIEMLHGAFARTLASWMSSYLRSPVRNTALSCEQLSFDEFCSSLPSPSVIAVFGISPPDGEAILWLNPLLAFAILERRLGGRGQAKGKMRELTDIEQLIMRGVILKILDMLTEAWSDVSAFSARLVNTVASPEFARVTAGNETVGAVAIELALGDVTGNIGLCFPYPLLQPALPRLASNRWHRREAGRQADARLPEALKKGISSVKVPVVMELGQTSILVGDFLDLAPGDIIKLDARRGRDLVVRVGRSAKFLARPGVIGKRLALQVSRVLYDRGGTL